MYIHTHGILVYEYVLQLIIPVNKILTHDSVSVRLRYPTLYYRPTINN